MSKQLTETETALLKVSHGVMTSADSGKALSSSCWTSPRAFDTVDHDIVVGRSFIVAVKHQRLKPAGRACGVPQGSILGPLLFLMYIFSLLVRLSNNLFSYQVFADDLQFYCSFQASEEH